MKFLTKPLYIKLRASTLLPLLLCVALLVTGIVLYRTYVFHNWCFQCLKAERIASVELYGNSAQDKIVLSAEEINALLPLLNSIRLREEPYADVDGLMGKAEKYLIRLKNGKEFDLQICTGDPACYILDDMAFPIGKQDTSTNVADYDNLQKLSNFYRTHAQR